MEPDAGTGRGVEVAPGVHWLRMRLPKPLSFVNVWALEDEGAWTIVDTGLDDAETLAAWRMALGSKPLRRVICTHLHPDHSGAAGKLCAEFGAEFWMTALEYLSAATEVASALSPFPNSLIAFFRSAGLSEQLVREVTGNMGPGKSQYRPMPPSYHRIRQGDFLMIGGRKWIVQIGSGHSPEHACLHCPDLDLLISGDQVLPKISSNVSVLAREPDGDPLADWIASLNRIRAVVPDGVLVLPSHKSPFYGLHARIDQLLEGHEEMLARLVTALRQPRRVADLFALLFASEITAGSAKAAVGEARAHLNWLKKRGSAQCLIDAEGIEWWQGTAG